MTDTNKLTEARIEIARLEAEVEFQKRMKDACVDVISDQAKEATAMRDELDALRAEVERLRLAIRFGGCSAVHAASLREAGGEWAVIAVQYADALRAEVKRLRADLREALSLLRDSGDVRICDRCCENADTVKEAGKWEKKCDALLAKHKET